ncbi:ATP-binding protein, partial [Candidatus Woesearchaeota archaeon]|nr:ATP-binding protein [Candidatus Woesearchaeota archaeon]
MVSLSVLEKKVKSLFGKSEEGNERLFNKVEIYKEFPNVDYSAKFIWNHFDEKGTIKKIAGKVGYIGNKLEGIPQMKTSDDGSVYPTKAVFIASVENSTYKVIFDDSYSNELKVTVECDIKDSKYINDLLNDPRNSVVSISKEYNDLESIKRLYKFITSKAEKFRINKTGLNKFPNMIIDDEIGLVPIDARIIATINGENYVFNILSRYGTKEVSVECPLNKTNDINNLLESILTEEIKDEKGEPVKKSIKGIDGITQIKNYDWSMVGGLGDAKKEIQQYIEWPLKNPELFKKVNTSMPKGILLIGPPGNGKTTIAKIIANQTESSFYAVSPKDINSMWVGGTEKNWGRLFDNARQDVRKGRSAIIFIDEIDGLYTSRGEMDKYSRISFG